MTVRNLEYLFRPRSVALVGASARAGSVGATLARNLIDGGLGDRVMLVNRAGPEIAGARVFRDVAELPEAPDLAVIATPAGSVPPIVSALAGRGVRAAVVISAGFGESADGAGHALQQQMLDAARPATLRVVGPNCVGVIAPESGLNASFAHLFPRPGRLAFVAQSGAIVTSILDWAAPRKIGFSHLVSLGDMADVDFGDMLDYLASEGSCRAILLYIEAVTNARKFLSAARAAARMKPVIVVKAGRHAAGARAAASHTGAMAGADDVYEMVFRRAGMLRVPGLKELFDAVEALAVGAPPRGERVAILTNGGGIGVLATDALVDAGGALAELAPGTLERLDAALPATWSRGNPVDIIGDADGPRYARALDVVMGDPGVDAVLVLNCPTAIVSGVDAARCVVDTAAKRRQPGVFTSWVGDETARAARRLFNEHGVPTYETPEQAVRGFMYLVEYGRSQRALMETPGVVPEQFAPRTEEVRQSIESALEAGRAWLSAAEAKAILSAYGIPVVATRVVDSPESAATAAAEIGYEVALKILSPDILHKSDVRGVALELPGPAAVREAAVAMAARVRANQPHAHIEGFTVEPMVRRPGAYELIVGLNEDRQFGPVVLFGHGGTRAELIADKALGLPPLNMHLARDIIDRTRIGRLLYGYRDHPAANLDAIALSLIRVAQLAIDHPEIVELDINPLLADEFGVVALDARIRLVATDRAASERLSIRPYPAELEENITLGDGRTLRLRPILPEDEMPLRAWFTRLDPEDVRLRFFVPMKTLSHVQAARFTQIDYDRDMALVLTASGPPGRSDIHGVVRISADPDNEWAEYAIIIAREMTGMGLGVLLMRRIIDYARSRGIKRLYGDVLRDNRTMLKLCDVLGFERSAIPGEPGLVRVTMTLGD